ncbi:DUF3667 domain-containing protein [Zunongwangia sp. F363]|uniref:DUF3667 domain-containing protein n=1 Tax=Autumnicola tepida TaxID=3075595 RepID=A0ABU3C5R4_9FLAO|nr:DUF3667 domain-containing protein [Zunongwangia sp. F363]MDT0641674.1 DUF3667 domain-containing protein [Zunongwangia sp. F363]
MKVKRSLLKYRGTRCLNCDHQLSISDRFCPRCGQMNSTKKLSFDDFFSEFFSGIFAYDSRFQRTLKALLFQPGKISKDYIQGRRMRYANPFRFYLSASIIFFLIMSFSSSWDEVEFGPNQAEFREELSRIPKDSLNQINQNLKMVPGLRQEELRVDSLVQSAAQENSYTDVYIPEEDLDTMGFWNRNAEKLKIFSEFHKETEIVNAGRAIDSLHYTPGTYNEWLYKKAVNFNRIYENPSIFVNYFISKLPFIIFFYLPVFALFIWLIYIRRPFNYMEHLIFAFHVQTTFFVLFSLALIFDYFISGDWGTTIAITVFVAYLYKALRKFYNQGRVKTVLKFIILSVIFFILALAAAVISALASFAIF